jgi:hypothetical protein
MNLAETIYQKSLDLPAEKAIEVIDFIDFLKNRTASKNSLHFNNQENGLKNLLASWSPLEEEFPEIADLPVISEDIF